MEWPEAFANSWVRRKITLDAMDWTTKGELIPVKNQGGVWLVLDVITDYFEGAWSLATGNVSPLSEQKLVD